MPVFVCCTDAAVYILRRRVNYALVSSLKLEVIDARAMPAWGCCGLCAGGVPMRALLVHLIIMRDRIPRPRSAGVCAHVGVMPMKATAGTAVAYRH